MLMDDLPILSRDNNQNTIIGVPLGAKNHNSFTFYNHYKFKVEIFNTSKSEFN